MNHHLTSCIVITNIDIISPECVTVYHLCCLSFKVNIKKNCIHLKMMSVFQYNVVVTVELIAVSILMGFFLHV